MEQISLIRKDTATGRQVHNVRSTTEARAVLDQWDQHPVLASRSAGRKGGLRIQKRAPKR